MGFTMQISLGEVSNIKLGLKNVLLTGLNHANPF